MQLAAGWGCLTTCFSSVREEMCEFVDCFPDMVEGRDRKGVRGRTVMVGPESAFLTQCLFFCFCCLCE